LTDMFSTSHRRRPSLQSGNSGVSGSKRSRASSAAHHQQQQQPPKGLSLSTSTSTLGGDTTYNSGESSREVLARAFQQQLATYQGAANSKDLHVPPKDRNTVESPIDPVFISRPTIVSKKIITTPQDDEYD